MMKKTWIVLLAAVSVLLIAGAALAADFEWMKDMNIKAQLDPSGFKASLATRFKIGNTQIDTVISNMPKPADAYMVLRLGEMSNRPYTEVMDRYKAGRDTGWGNLAKSLGIKPGSAEFHALKRGHDLNGGDGGSGKGKGKGKGKKGKGHGKD